MARIITKGLIGAEDLSLGTGTFTRATSVGGTQVLHQINLSTFAQLVPVNFASLPAPAEGMLAAVTDSTVNTFGTAITVGGGTYNVLAFYNGTNWVVV